MTQVDVVGFVSMSFGEPQGATGSASYAAPKAVLFVSATDHLTLGHCPLQ
jgi:hypothetical protein